MMRSAIDRLRVAELMALWPKGCKPPSGYCAWHDWAEAQHAHGLRQVKCRKCGKYKYPQEKCKHV